MQDHPMNKHSNKITRRPDPTPAQIRKRCKAIRRGWSEHERRKRAACVGTGRAEVAVVPTDCLDGVEHLFSASR